MQDEICAKQSLLLCWRALSPRDPTIAQNAVMVRLADIRFWHLHYRLGDTSCRHSGERGRCAAEETIFGAD